MAFFRLAADATILAHLAFIAVALFGGFLVPRWPRFAWVHLPVFLWAVVVNLFGWPCPLTTFENSMRSEAGLLPYAGAFVSHYLLPESLSGPSGLRIELGIALLVLLLNVGAYARVLWRWRHQTSAPR